MRTAMVTIAAAVLLFCTPGLHAAAVDTPAAPPEKLWATDLPAFLNERPGEWIVGVSSEPALTAAEAESFARRDAAEPLTTRLRHRLPHASWPTLLRRVQAALASDELVVDRHVTSQERPYGTIWRAAVLVDGSPRRLDRLVRDVQRETRQRYERAAAGVAGTVAIAFVVGTCYLGLNWLTRGFFRGRLMTAAVLVVSVGIFGIVQLL